MCMLSYFCHNAQSERIFFGGQSLADHASTSCCLMTQKIEESLLFEYVPESPFKFQAFVRRFTPPTSGIHIQRLFLIAPVSQIWDQPAISAIKFTHMTVATPPPPRNQTAASYCDSSPTYDSISIHTRVMHIKGQWLFLYLIRVLLFQPFSSFPFKRDFGQLSQNKGRRGNRDWCRPKASSMEEVWLSNDSLWLLFYFRASKRGTGKYRLTLQWIHKPLRLRKKFQKEDYSKITH